MDYQVLVLLEDMGKAREITERIEYAGIATYIEDYTDYTQQPVICQWAVMVEEDKLDAAKSMMEQFVDDQDSQTATVPPTLPSSAESMLSDLAQDEYETSGDYAGEGDSMPSTDDDSSRYGCLKAWGSLVLIAIVLGLLVTKCYNRVNRDTGTPPISEFVETEYLSDSDADTAVAVPSEKLDSDTTSSVMLSDVDVVASYKFTLEDVKKQIEMENQSTPKPIDDGVVLKSVTMKGVNIYYDYEVTDEILPSDISPEVKESMTRLLTNDQKQHFKDNRAHFIGEGFSQVVELGVICNYRYFAKGGKKPIITVSFPASKIQSIAKQGGK